MCGEEGRKTEGSVLLLPLLPLKSISLFFFPLSFCVFSNLSCLILSSFGFSSLLSFSCTSPHLLSFPPCRPTFLLLLFFSSPPPFSSHLLFLCLFFVFPSSHLLVPYSLSFPSSSSLSVLSSSSLFSCFYFCPPYLLFPSALFLFLLPTSSYQLI